MRGRRNWLIGLVVVAVAVLLLLYYAGIIPDGLYDTLQRAWPALLVLFGLAAFLRNRVPVSGLIAILVSGLLVVGVASTAFATRASQQREDYRYEFEQSISSEISLLRLQVSTGATNLNIVPAEGTTVSGEFVGSAHSAIIVEYDEDGSGGATLTIAEGQTEPFPVLEAVGRGAMQLRLPSNVAVDLVIDGESGAAGLNLADTMLERLNLSWQRGDALVSLPAYQPRSPNVLENPGTLSVLNGNVTIAIPENVAARLELNRRGSGIEPQADDRIYNYLRDDVLESRNYDTADIVIRYVVVSQGLIRVEDLPAAGGT
jgi:hypothetical protein